MFLRSEGNRDKLIKNIKNILEQNKSSSAEYFAAHYVVEDIEINMNKNYILDEALQLKLPTKIITSPHKILIPKIILSKELDTSKYNEVQNKLLEKLQELIDNHAEIGEEEILKFERQTFLEFAKDPKVLDKLRVYGNN